MKEWSKRLGLSPATIYHRINTYGMSIEEALTRKKNKHLVNNKHNSKKK